MAETRIKVQTSSGQRLLRVSSSVSLTNLRQLLVEEDLAGTNTAVLKTGFPPRLLSGPEEALLSTLLPPDLVLYVVEPITPAVASESHAEASLANPALTLLSLTSDSLHAVLGQLGLPSLCACKAVCTTLASHARLTMCRGDWRVRRVTFALLGFFALQAFFDSRSFSSLPEDALHWPQSSLVIGRALIVTQIGMADRSGGKALRLLEGPFVRHSDGRLSPSNVADFDCMYDRMPHERCLKCGAAVSLAELGPTELVLIDREPTVGQRMVQVKCPALL